MILDDYGSPAWAWKEGQYNCAMAPQYAPLPRPMNLEEFDAFVRRLFTGEYIGVIDGDARRGSSSSAPAR